MTERRELGPTLTAEAWHPIGTDGGMLWLHPPSRQGVLLDAEVTRRSCRRSVALPEEPVSPDEIGYMVCFDTMHHECGEPLGIGESLWTAKWSEAIRYAREMRSKILASHPKYEPSKQVTFDDLLERANKTQKAPTE